MGMMMWSLLLLVCWLLWCEMSSSISSSHIVLFELEVDVDVETSGELIWVKLWLSWISSIVMVVVIDDAVVVDAV